MLFWSATCPRDRALLPAGIFQPCANYYLVCKGRAEAGQGRARPGQGRARSDSAGLGHLSGGRAGPQARALAAAGRPGPVTGGGGQARPGHWAAGGQARSLAAAGQAWHWVRRAGHWPRRAGQWPRHRRRRAGQARSLAASGRAGPVTGGGGQGTGSGEQGRAGRAGQCRAGLARGVLKMSLRKSAAARAGVFDCIFRRCM